MHGTGVHKYRLHYYQPFKAACKTDTFHWECHQHTQKPTYKFIYAHTSAIHILCTCMALVHAHVCDLEDHLTFIRSLLYCKTCHFLSLPCANILTCRLLHIFCAFLHSCGLKACCVSAFETHTVPHITANMYCVYMCFCTRTICRTSYRIPLGVLAGCYYIVARVNLYSAPPSKGTVQWIAHK